TPQLEYNPADSLLPYSEIVTPTLSYSPILSRTPSPQLLAGLNLEEEPDQSDFEENNQNEEEHTGEYHTPTLSPILSPVIAPQQPPSPPPIQIQPQQPNMANQALTATADAINALATALQNGREQTLITVEPFKGDSSQDPYTWITEFERAAQANHWEDDRKFQLASVYLKGIAADWYRSLQPVPNAYNNDAQQNQSFKHLFLARFSTTQQKARWQKQLFEIKQGTDTVDAYVSKFKRLRKRVDPTDAFPANFVIQLFIQGLRPEYGIAVQAAEPGDLDAAILAAQRWETGHVMSKPTSDTDQAIKQLTEQIAQLSINLAAKQPEPPASVNYADAPQQAQKIKQPPTCHYCGRTGHFIANCNTRKKNENQRSGRPRYNNRDNWRSRSRSRSRDNSNRNRSRSRDRDNYRRNDNNRNRSPSLYHRDVYYRDQDNTSNKTPISTSKWEALLDNPSIRAALSTHLAQQPINHQTLSNFTTPVKCNVQLKNRPYQAIIDSGASISMIAHRVV
ncbi:MAG TPA: retrotransposon gag family protein, partial [Nitrososphaera sp.]